MEPRAWYIVILVVITVTAIISLINFIQLLKIYNDDDATISQNASLTVVVFNAILTFLSFAIGLYCIWKLVKKDEYEPDIFKAYKSDRKLQRLDVLPKEPLVACNDLPLSYLAKDRSPEAKAKLTQYQKLNVDLEKFEKECNSNVALFKTFEKEESKLNEKFNITEQLTDIQKQIDALKGQTRNPEPKMVADGSSTLPPGYTRVQPGVSGMIAPN